MRRRTCDIQGLGPTLPAAAGFGEALRSARQRRHRSQTDLAESIDCNTGHISRLESGKRNPSRRMVEQLIPALRLGRAEAAVLFVSAGFAAEPASAAGEVAALAALLDDPAVPRRERDAARRIVADVVASLAIAKAATPRIAGRQHAQRH